MKHISIGTNIIENCETPFVIAGKPLFSFYQENDSVLLSFQISSPPASSEISVKDNVVQKGDVAVKKDSHSVSVTVQNANVVELTIENDTARVNLDLRPLGLRIYTDANALHIGRSQLSQNTIKNCKNGIVIG